MKLPIKTRILEWAIERDDAFDARELSEILQVEYNGERTTTVEKIEQQLDMYCRVNFMEAADTRLDENNELLVTYKITDIGKKSVKYIPSHGNKLF